MSHIRYCTTRGEKEAKMSKDQLSDWKKKSFMNVFEMCGKWYMCYELDSDITKCSSLIEVTADWHKNTEKNYALHNKKVVWENSCGYLSYLVGFPCLSFFKSRTCSCSSKTC